MYEQVWCDTLRPDDACFFETMVIKNKGAPVYIVVILFIEQVNDRYSCFDTHLSYPEAVIC
jgi:hypothetical protein